MHAYRHARVATVALAVTCAVPSLAGASAPVEGAPKGAVAARAAAVTVKDAPAGAVAARAAAVTVKDAPAGAVRAAKPQRARIVVRVNDPRARVHLAQLGVNHAYMRNGLGLWDAAADRPEPKAVARSRAAGVQSVRFPGGTVANTYDWKKAIGPTRGCQVDGDGDAQIGYGDVEGLAYGPDEGMRFLDAVQAKTMIMVPFATESPADAADWVEYMNGRADRPGNPGGGRDWADVRASNGHRAPYDIQRWEIGNEPSHSRSRHWMSQSTATAVRQYAFGGTRDVVAEPLGKDCRHPVKGVRSNGSADQVFSVMFPPVAPAATSVTVAGKSWRRVKDLSNAGPRERVYQLQAEQGDVVFGDGKHGKAPADGTLVRATYRSVHRGFFAFAKALRAVDPGIDVCASWDTPAFLRVAGDRRLDCLTAHAITSFAKIGTDDWDTAIEGHDRQQLAVSHRQDKIAELTRLVPRHTPLLITEASFINGDTEAFPKWPTSMSHAVAMTGLWATWMRLGISWGMGDDLLWYFDRAVLGPAPDFTVTADAVTRKALLPMYEAGGRVLRTDVPVNPERDPGLEAGTYKALNVVATRDRDKLWLLVANRLPRSTVRARVQVPAARLLGKAAVRQVAADSFRDYNRPGGPRPVRLTTDRRPIQRHGFAHSFAPSSVTIFRLTRR